MTERLLTAREVAAMLGLSVETVLRWAKTGRLPSIELSSRAIRFRESEVIEWLAEHERGAAPRGVSATHGDRAHHGGYAPLLSPVSATPPHDAAPTEEVPLDAC